MNTTSNDGAEPAVATDAASRQRLEAAVRRLLEEHAALRRRAAAAEGRVRELESALNALSTGQIDPLALSDQVRSYERDNRILTKRLSQAREAVERIQSRLQFLEGER